MSMTPCDPGHSCDLNNLCAPKICPLNSYQDASGALTCKSCPSAPQGSVSCGGNDVPNRRSLKAVRGDEAIVVRESADVTASGFKVTDKQDVTVLDAGMYAAASFAILLISGVAARKLFITSGLKSASDYGTDAAGNSEISIKGVDGDDGLDNVRKRKT